MMEGFYWQEGEVKVAYVGRESSLILNFLTLLQASGPNLEICLTSDKTSQCSL